MCVLVLKVALPPASSTLMAGFEHVSLPLWNPGPTNLREALRILENRAISSYPGVIQMKSRKCGLSFNSFHQVTLTLGNYTPPKSAPCSSMFNLASHKLVSWNFTPALNTPTCLTPFFSFASYFLDMTSAYYLFYFVTWNSCSIM